VICAIRGGDSLRLLHQTPSGWRIEVGEIRCVTHRDDQDVSRIDRLDIHERGDLLVAKKKRCRQLAGQ
jgi:hypothetical protein